MLPIQSAQNGVLSYVIIGNILQLTRVYDGYTSFLFLGIVPENMDVPGHSQNPAVQKAYVSALLATLGYGTSENWDRDMSMDRFKSK